MRGMFYLTESESESDTSDLSRATSDEQSRSEPVNTEQEEDTLGYNLIIPHLPPAAAANFQNRTDHWTHHGQ
eukprot:2517939-Pyramimonas_sp.AAC.1